MSKWLFEALQLQVKKSMLYISSISKHLQKCSKTQNCQNIKQTQLPKQIPNLRNEMCVM